MFDKVTIVALFAIFAIFPTPGDAEVDLWQTLTAKWASSLSDPYRSNSFFELPLTYEAALEEGWVDAEGLTCESDVVGLIYKCDPTVGLFFNSSTGCVMGIQMAIPVQSVANLVHVVNYANVAGITKKTINDEEYWTAAVIFNKAEHGIHQLWFREGDELIDLPTHTAGLTTKKACLDARGTYYSLIDSTTTSANLFPWNLIAVGEQIIGFWFLVIGPSPPPCDGSREWFNDISGIDVKGAIPDASECLLNDIDEYTATSIHFWLLPKPWDIVCQESECS